ncbi:phosphatase PAP2 family protein [Saccharothrix algeriensis]|uniref:Phosphatase PAP2 family protein n=1 Tax=Saccharothrix algeriensis TaxID=173560 RepID=A0A8T8I2K9_9PSEU|nr:phosphatase PAP2 family protein [Saccharothrix algeriensis]MBM7810816.1 undecaprenyl-diphosphatase [Saccharothrix algeriensis]QTR04851.1 phosphatase PAP2 family protein [Saccharothrix algeriensis]
MTRPALGSVGAVLVLASVVLGCSVHREVPGLDAALRGAAGALGPELVAAAAVVSFLLSPGLAVVAVVSLGLRALLAREPLVLRAAVLLSVAWSTVLARFAYDRVRPVEHHLPSYPSGHVTAVTAVVFTGVVLCAHLARRHLRKAVALAVVAVALTAASRVVLDVHWFTDTVGAALATTGVGLLATLPLRLLPVGVGSGREQP